MMRVGKPAAFLLWYFF